MWSLIVGQVYKELAQGGHSELITCYRNSNLEYDNEEKEEVGIATKLVKQEEREEGDHIVLCGADLVGAELLPIPLGVIDEDSPIFYRLFSVRFPVHDIFLQSLPPSQYSSPRAATRTIGTTIVFVVDQIPQWPFCRCIHDRILDYHS